MDGSTFGVRVVDLNSQGKIVAIAGHALPNVDYLLAKNMALKLGVDLVALIHEWFIRLCIQADSIQVIQLM